MRIKRDYMGNDQLLPAYNMKAAICDEYIAVIDAKPYASDMEKFIFRYHTHVKGNKYDRTEEVYECETVKDVRIVLSVPGNRKGTGPPG